MKHCTIEGCERVTHAKGWCKIHYLRWRRHGSFALVTERHGMRETSEYHSWAGMKARCFNPNNPSYYRYGGRGITVCSRWAGSFEAFLGDMGRAPSPVHSIDRIDNDGNYEPGNCRWATQVEQGRNRRGRSDSATKVKGVSYRDRYVGGTAKPWESYIGIGGSKIYLGMFATEAEAVEARKAAEKRYWA